MPVLARRLAMFLPLLALPCALLGQQPGSQPPQQTMPERPSSVVVSVRQPDGSPLERPAVVNLYAFTGAVAAIGVYRSGTAEFTNLGPGNYTLEIITAGYQKLTEQVSILAGGERVHLTVELKAEGTATPTATGPPALAPAAEKEMSKALESLRGNKLEDARKHLEKATKAAPAHPDVNYVWGLYYVSANDFVHAKESWEQSVQLSPKHAFSLAGLAQIATQTGDYNVAVDYLKRATDAAPSSWRFHEKLAEAYLHQQQFGEAQKQALRAIEQGKERAATSQFVLAKILEHNNDHEAALKALDLFLASQPTGPQAAEARLMADRLRNPQLAEAAASAPQQLTTRVPENPVHLASDTHSRSRSSASTTLAPSVASSLMPAPKWMPPDVDDSMPPVESVAACPLQEIQERAGKRVSEFVDAVNRIAATESLENEVIDREGLAIRREARHYSYVAAVQQVRPGMYTMEEYRNGMMDLDQFPERIATLGLTALVMIFHPIYQDDYEITCEGLSRWHDGLAWQLHFRQKADKPARLRSYRVNANSYPIALRGRAWISTETFQIETLETDLLRPLPQIQLRSEHISVEYAPVQFVSHRQRLWLPERAEIYFDYGNRRMHRTHNFRDYMLFAVDEKQQISNPTLEADQSGSGSQPR